MKKIDIKNPPYTLVGVKKSSTHYHSTLFNSMYLNRPVTYLNGHWDGPWFHGWIRVAGYPIPLYIAGAQLKGITARERLQRLQDTFGKISDSFTHLTGAAISSGEHLRSIFDDIILGALEKEESRTPWIPYKIFYLFKRPRIKIRVYQEPTRIGGSIGIDISENGWRRPLFHLHLLIWEIDLEINFSDHDKSSNFNKALYNITKDENASHESV